ncbi:hypothetical protein ACFSQD_00040 [Flavihumibacter stibioxidans]|nr:hypothetical protein [Flavihumibacter stibioxidans]
MKYLLLILGVFFYPGIAMPQSSGFIYIESEPSRPFYLRTLDSLYVSSSGNYIILAPLGQLKGDIIVGFPGRQQAAFVFTLPDTTTDRGLVLRDMRQEGWRLVDWRNNEPLITRRLGRQEDEYAGMYRRSDAFAVRLSQVVNDSSVLFYSKAVVRKNETALSKTEAGIVEKTAIGGPRPIAETRKVQPGSELSGQAEIAAPIKSGNADTALSGELVKSNTEAVPLNSIVTAGTQAKDSTGKADMHLKPVGALPGAGESGKKDLTPVRLISRKDTGKTWVLVYEVREGNTIDRVEVEIDKDRVTFAP